MYLRGNKALFVAASILSIAISFTLALHVAAQDAPTPEQQKELAFFGLTSSIMRPADLKILYGGCEFNPYPILEQRYKGVCSGDRAEITPQGGGVSGDYGLRNGINPSLACRLVKFFQYAEQTKGCRNITINCGYRSAQKQADMCGSGGPGCAPPGKSCHQYGLAVDISSSCTSWMRSYLGTKNPRAPGAQQFMLHFPYSGDHIQCMENFTASCNPSSKGCDGKIGISSDLNFIPRQSPTSAFSQALRQWFSPPPQSAIPAQPAIPSRPASANPLESFKENNAENEIGGVSSQIDTGTISSSSSTAADRLEELAFGPKPATTTATSVPLVVSGSNAVVLTGSQNISSDGAPTQGTISPSQTTFVSSDLSWQGTESVSSAPVSGFQAVLITIKATLLRMLQYLVPFAPRDNVQIDGSGEFHTLE